jgi:ribonucleotide reductase alpha subunit
MQVMNEHLYVIKRDGTREPVSFDQVLRRIQTLADGLDHVNPDLVAQRVCSQIQNGIKTSELDEFAAETCAMMQARYHPNYGKLAARILIDNQHKNTPGRLIDSVQVLFDEGIVSESYYSVAQDLALETIIDYSRDFVFDYFGYKTLERGYLLKRRDGRTWERPQHMWMRVAIELHDTHLDRVKETYDALSQGYFIHATPTLFNSGTKHAQLSSCFLVHTQEDSIKGIYDTLGECAQISKWAGGIGLSIHNIRARDAQIHGTNGKSTGIVPMLKVFNDTAKYVNQGGKRNGSFAIYLEPWHADIEDFLRLKLNTGAEDERARDLFYGLWIPDLFMQRVEQDGVWCLMSPDECPGLSDAWGDEFNRLYNAYERDHKYVKEVSAKKLWQMIVDAQIQTGTPYLLYKDACNAKSNQQHLGTIKSSNLCVAPETEVDVRIVPIAPPNFTGRELQLWEIQNPISVVSGRIDSFAGKTVDIWNGNSWSKVVVAKTGSNQMLLRVEISVDSKTEILYCTEYHKFILPTHPRISECKRVEAKNLVPGTILQGYLFDGKWMSQKVISVTFDGRWDDTYCFTEPINHAGVFNGILTGNCSEIIEYTSPEETAVCNLGSLALPRFVKRSYAADGEYRFDFEALRAYTTILARNLDIVIDKTYYPTDKCSRSNMRHRPIGIGVQGLADVFALLRIPWTSQEATNLNREIFENIYYAAAMQSMLGASQNDWRGLAVDTERTYPSFDGSPMSSGKMQFDLWNDTPKTTYLNWNMLRTLCKGGMRNSLLLAMMPTASTSQILGNNECIEPFTSNMYSRRVLAGEFMVVNKYLVEDLVRLGLWTSEIRTEIIANGGSIQSIERIPAEVRELYRTVWEIPMKTIINLARDRAPFICQSQSLNLFIAEPTASKVSSMHFYAWKQGLKTGCYYLRTKAAARAQQFTVEPPSCLTCSS